MMKVMQTRPVPEMQATGTKIDKSRMMGDYQVRFCERVRLKCRALLDLGKWFIRKQGCCRASHGNAKKFINYFS